MKRILFFVFFLLLLLLGVVRLLGETNLKVVPEVSPEVVVDSETPLFQNTAALLSAAPGEADSLFYPLSDPHLALISRIRLVENAVAQVDAQYYLFHDDDAGRGLLGALVAAAERGVKVRLLLDDMDVPGREALFARLAEHENIAVRVFNPVWFRSLRSVEFLARFPRVTRRMHNKALVVDNIASIVGGRNIGNEYFAVNTEMAFTDFDILASGAISAEVAVEFNRYWYSGIAVEASKIGEPASVEDYQQWLQQLAEAMKTFKQGVADHQQQVVEKLTNETLRPYFDQGQVIYDQPEKVLASLTDRNGHLAPKIMALMASAEKQLLIASPYFIPGKRGVDLFRKLQERGVEVIILTNSLAANDVVAVHSGYMDYRRELLELGVVIHELKATNDERSLSFLGSKNVSLHAKSFIVDQNQIYVGSFNLDPRSAIHNTEMGIVFDSKAYALQVYQGLQKYLDQHAYQVFSVDGELEWHGLTADGSKTVLYAEPDTDWLQRMAVYLMSWLPVEWLL